MRIPTIPLTSTTRAGGTIAAVSSIVALLASGCGEPPTVPETRPPEIHTEPSAGTPGAVVAVVGIAAPMDASLEARVDGRPAPVVVSESGAILLAIPLDVAGTDGTSPPADPVDVELIADGAGIGFGEGVLKVAAMPDAPGAADELRRELAALSANLGGILDALHPEPTEAEAYALAVTGALAEIVDGDGDGSLSAVLESLTADELALVDRFLAASGILDRTRELAASIASVLDGLEKPLPTADARSDPRLAQSTLTSDLSLARQMQFQVVASLFAETVVHETAATYAETVGLAAGAAGLVQSVPGAAVVAAIVGVIDFSVNKVLVGLLPSEISALDLTLEDNTLAPGETTTARVDITAVNTPPSVGIQDFVGLTITLLGLGGSSAAQSFEDVLLDTAAFFLATIQQGLAAYAGDHPELDLDVQFSLVPVMTWEAVIHDTRLVDRLTLTPEVVTGAEGEVNWVAATSRVGEGRIFARTAIGPDAVLIDLPVGFTYAGGAFGENVASTDTRTVQVLSGLVVEVDFSETIEEGGINALGVRAGYALGGGDPIWSEGLRVDLTVDGGEVAESSGVTDGTGRFSTLAQLLPGSQRIIVSVTVGDAYGQQETVSVEATTGSAGTVTLLDGGYIEVGARYILTVGAYGPGYAPILDTATVRERTDVTGAASWTAQATSTGDATHPDTGDQAWGEGTSVASLDVGLGSPGADVVASFHLTASTSAGASSSRNDLYNGATAMGWVEQVMVRFEVAGGPVHYELTSQFEDSPSIVRIAGEFEHLKAWGPIVAPQLSGTLDEGEYYIQIGTFSCAANSPGQPSCAAGFQIDLELTRMGG